MDVGGVVEEESGEETGESDGRKDPEHKCEDCIGPRVEGMHAVCGHWTTEERESEEKGEGMERGKWRFTRIKDKDTRWYAK